MGRHLINLSTRTAGAISRVLRNTPKDDQDADNRRRRPRLRPQGITCGGGEVLDISATGLKISVKGRLAVQDGDIVDLTLISQDQELEFSARVAWSKHTRVGTSELGLEFVDLPQRQSELIKQIALTSTANGGFSQAS